MEAVSTGSGTDAATMTGYHYVFGWFLLHLVSLATFPQFCRLVLWASLDVQLSKMTFLELEMQWTSSGPRGEPGFEYSFSCARKKKIKKKECS